MLGNLIVVLLKFGLNWIVVILPIFIRLSKRWTSASTKWRFLSPKYKRKEIRFWPASIAYTPFWKFFTMWNGTKNSLFMLKCANDHLNCDMKTHVKYTINAKKTSFYWDYLTLELTILLFCFFLPVLRSARTCVECVPYKQFLFCMDKISWSTYQATTKHCTIMHAKEQCSLSKLSDEIYMVFFHTTRWFCNRGIVLRWKLVSSKTIFQQQSLKQNNKYARITSTLQIYTHISFNDARCYNIVFFTRKQLHF